MITMNYLDLYSVLIFPFVFLAVYPEALHDVDIEVIQGFIFFMFCILAIYNVYTYTYYCLLEN